MNCNDVRNHYEEYFSKILPQDKIREIEQHLGVCQDCRQEYAENKIVAEVMKENAYCTIDKACLSQTISKAMVRIEELSNSSIYNRILLLFKENLSVRKLSFAVMFVVIGFLGGIVFQLYNQQKKPIVILPYDSNKERLPYSLITPISLNNQSTLSGLSLSEVYLRPGQYRIVLPSSEKEKSKSTKDSLLSPKEKQIVNNIEKLSTEKSIDIDTAIKKSPEEGKDQVTLISGPLSGIQSEATAMYNRAEEYTAQGKYFDALREFQNVIRNNPMNLLASKSLYNIANIELKELYDFEGALKDFQRYLDYYPDKYISKEIKEEVLEKIKMLTQSSQDNWASLKIFLSAQKVEPSQSLDFYFTIIKNYPHTPLAEKSVDND